MLFGQGKSYSTSFVQNKCRFYEKIMSSFANIHFYFDVIFNFLGLFYVCLLNFLRLLSVQKTEFHGIYNLNILLRLKAFFLHFNLCCCVTSLSLFALSLLLLGYSEKNNVKTVETLYGITKFKVNFKGHGNPANKIALTSFLEFLKIPITRPKV